MKFLRLSALFILLYPLLFVACKKEQETAIAPSDFGYVPTNTGHWVIYDVDSIVHADNDGETDDSVRYYHFQIKEVINGTFTDGEGRPAQRIERYRRNTPADEWQITNVWTSTVTSSHVERMEENIRYIPVAFPINADHSWNGNAYNQLGEREYSYENFHQPFSIGSFSFDSTITVSKSRPEEDNFVERIFLEERFAVHVGRIYKVEQTLGKNGASQVVSGLDYTETIVDYGD